MSNHWHRNGNTLYLNGVLYFGCAESKNMYVGVNGTFITQQKTDGTYRGAKRGGTRTRYFRVHPGKGLDDYAHRIVYEVCSGTEIQDGYEIDHINGDSLDNRIENLRFVSHKENVNNPISIERNRQGIKRRSKNEIWKKNLSESKKRYFQSEEGAIQKIRMREERVGKKLSEEHHRKLIEIGAKNKIPIIGVEVLTNKTKTFDSQEDASRELGILAPLINQQLHGKLKQTHGWKFSYLKK